MIKPRLMKRTASFAISAALLLSCIPAGAYAATDDVKTLSVPISSTEKIQVSYDTNGDGSVNGNKATTVDGVDYYAESAIPDTLYGSARMTWSEFWAGEGVLYTNDTEVNTNNDPVNETDLGAYDAVSRATYNYGVSHSGYQFWIQFNGVNEETGETAKAIMAFERDANGNTVLRAGDSTEGVEVATEDTETHGKVTTSIVGFKLNGKTYVYDSYDVLGYSRIPVAVEGKTYVEKMVLKDAGKDVPAAFSNVTIGGKDGSGAAVTEATGGMKVLNADGTYGMRTAGTTTRAIDYKVVSKGGTDVVAIDYNTEWGDYADAYVYLQKENEDSDGSKTTLTAAEYEDYAINLLGVRYDYYGTTNPDTNPNAAPIASYGSKNAADTWFGPSSKKARIEVGFNFDAKRLGGSGVDTTANGIFNKGGAAGKTGYWKLTVYSAGYDDVTRTVYIKDQYGTPDVSISSNLKTLSLKNVDAKLKAALAAGTEMKIQKTEGRSSVDIAALKANSSGTYNIVLAEGQTLTEGTYQLAIAATDKYPARSIEITIGSPESIKLSKSTLTLYKSKTATLTATTAPALTNAAAVTWTSSKTSVATVNANGKITAKAAGTATITAKLANGKTATCKVTVKNPTLKLTKSKATIKKGKKVTIKAKATPTAKITYKSSNKKVATVTSKGVVKGKKKGTAKITVKANGISKTFKVTVK